MSEELCPSSSDVPVPLPFFVRTSNQVWHPALSLSRPHVEIQQSLGLVPQLQYFGVLVCLNTCRAIGWGGCSCTQVVEISWRGVKGRRSRQWGDG